MKRVTRITESELRRMIYESVSNALDESDRDWASFEQDKYIDVNGEKRKEKDHRKYLKNKNKGESFKDYQERVKKETADKRAATKAEKAERAEAKKQGLTLKKYRQQQEDNKVEKAVAESIRRYINKLL